MIKQRISFNELKAKRTVARSTERQQMENTQVDINELQAYRQIEFEPIAAKYFVLVALRTAVFFVMASAAMLLIGTFNAVPLIKISYICGGLLTLLSIYLFITKQTFKYRGIAVREHDVIFRTGFINITETLVPYKRVQHVKLKRGFIERSFGLSQLLVFTASGAAHNLSISGLEADKAEKIKTYIIDRFDIQGIAPVSGDNEDQNAEDAAI